MYPRKMLITRKINKTGRRWRKRIFSINRVIFGGDAGLVSVFILLIYLTSLHVVVLKSPFKPVSTT